MDPNEMTDTEVLARTIWGEARGEGLEGMAAVANTIMNRVHIDLGNDGKPDWWGEGVKGVCLKPWQYSCWNENDPNREKLLDVTTETSWRYSDALMLAEAAVAGKLHDRTNGATHYYAPALVHQPKWAAGHKPTATIGRQVFYRITS